MSELQPGKRRRADAERSVAAILEAAENVLGQRPDASMEDIAKAAGTSRQTVYAHFPSRDALLTALLTTVTDRVVAAIEAAELDQGLAREALARFLDVSWRALGPHPFLLAVATPQLSPEEDYERHQPVLRPLEELLRRGQRSGEFTRKLPLTWLLQVIFSLDHATLAEIRAGRMNADEAMTTLHHTIARLVAPDPTEAH